MSELITVAQKDDLKPGQGKVVDAKGQEIALFRVGDDFFAIDNQCPHRHGPLGEGYLQNDIVTCPWHGWQFNVKTGENAIGMPGGVKTYKVTVEGNSVKVAV
ncbi:MAG: non-heme iron oxygenase ferredoxin subunit [Deltaproteobacteria bacterium]|nr:non-heme iron oxygenase ferredoxin subunit [Deltaproteobacteria bacterium]